MPNIQYFLGGNTPAGFYSLYHQLSDPTRMRALYIIKGGPGSGKSTLMRRVERHEKKKYQKETSNCETAFRLGLSLEFPGD